MSRQLAALTLRKVADRLQTPGRVRDRLERDEGIVVRFVVGHSADRTLERGMAAEEAAHRDFLRLPFRVPHARPVPSSMHGRHGLHKVRRKGSNTHLRTRG